MALLEQGWDQPGADEAGRAGDEYRSSHAVPTVPRGRSDASDGHALPHRQEVTRRNGIESRCDRLYRLAVTTTFRLTQVTQARGAVASGAHGCLDDECSHPRATQAPHQRERRLLLGRTGALTITAVITQQPQHPMSRGRPRSGAPSCRGTTLLGYCGSSRIAAVILGPPKRPTSASAPAITTSALVPRNCSHARFSSTFGADHFARAIPRDTIRGGSARDVRANKSKGGRR